MSKKIKIPLKIVAFLTIFYFLCIFVANVLRDDADAYSRILMHELYEQKDGIDILYCGASHVSHGIVASVADEMTGKRNFSSGTAAQSIDGTYAVLRQATSLYDIEKVFLELDFAVATQKAKKDRTGFSSDYLVALYLKDYLMNISEPKYYINHLLPIGKDKHLTLRPQDLIRKAGGVINGDYFRYNYLSDDSEYAGRGCVMDWDKIVNGSFVNDKDEGRIRVEAISEDWKSTVDKIIALCKEKNIELTMYSMPCSDYYLNEKGNYDEYYYFVKDFCAERGFDYYDFNLAKKTFFLPEDEDFTDDNHFNKQGVSKWTRAFWTFFGSENVKEDFFYDSYAEKMENIGDKVFGLVVKTSEDKKSVSITPVTNIADKNRIKYEVCAITKTKNIDLDTRNVQKVSLPPKSSGKLHIKAFVDGVLTNETSLHFTSL